VRQRHGRAWRPNRDGRENLEPFERELSGIVGVYQRYDFADEKREALTLWAQHIAGLVVAQEGLALAA
jgi:hypothetical protein